MVSGGGSDIFISKLDPLGNYLWAKKIGGTGTNNGGADIVVDVTGNVYTTGWFEGVADFDPGLGTVNLNASSSIYSMFVWKLDALGNYVWANSVGYWGGEVIGKSISVDGVGNVYTTGSFRGSFDFDPGIGTYTLVATGGQGTGFESDVFIQKLGKCPTITTIVNGLYITSNQVGATYQWIDCTNGNVVITGETNANYTATVNGDYAVIVTANGCTDTSACVNINTVGINENSLNSEFRIYPNPAVGGVTIDLGDLKNAQISIVNITGQEVYSQENVSESQTNISLKEFSKGIYFVKVQSDQQQQIIKLIKQ